MNIRCLTSIEVKLLLAHLEDEEICLKGDLANQIDAAKEWEFQIVCHNLFVARHIDAEEGGLEKIARIYTVEEEMFLELQEGGDTFVEYLLRHTRLANETLDEALITIQEGLSKCDYEKALRY